MKNIPLFKSGKTYPISSTPVLVERTRMRPNIKGGQDEILLSGRESAFTLTAENGEICHFIDARHLQKGVHIESAVGNLTEDRWFPLQLLLDHFDIPAVLDIAQTHPEKYQAAIANIRRIELFIQEQLNGSFEFEPFQVDDLARASLTSGIILSWQAGLGKSIGAIVYSLLQTGVDWEATRRIGGFTPTQPCLIVAPGNLHDQLEREWRKWFGIHAIRIRSQDAYDAMLGKDKRLKPAFYLSSYTQMGLNKIEKMPFPLACPRDFDSVARMMHFYGVTMEDLKGPCATGELGVVPLSIFDRGIAACQERFEKYADGVGEYKNGIKCIFGASLADKCGHEFAVVVIDEGTRIKGENTKVGMAIRELRPAARAVLTATPLKNRLRDMFYLLHWTSGGNNKATPRFPFSNDSDQQDKFSADYNVCERNLTVEREAEKQRGEKKKVKRRKKARGKPGVMVCNMHKLWKIISSLVIRRRKDDIGVDIAAKHKHIIRAPLGDEQYQVYRYHLQSSYCDKEGNPAFMSKLQALRSAAAAPHSELLKEQEDDHHGTFRSRNEYIPKLAACLTVIAQRMKLGEQCVVFSPLLEPLDTLSAKLKEAGIPHDVVDGRVSPQVRGELSTNFRAGFPTAKPVLLAGLRAMSEGNNWPLANNAIMLSYDWAYDANDQAPDRCNRLDSVKDLEIWSIVADGSIDLQLESGYDEKGDAAELVLDGALLDKDCEEVNPMELLRVAESDFRSAKTYPEAKLVAEWPALKAELGASWKECQRLTGKQIAHKAVQLSDLLSKLKQMEAA